jgi:hypothetical protein
MRYGFTISMADRTTGIRFRNLMLQSILLKTDQINCYNETGDAVPCGGSGQDGETNRTLCFQETRFKVRDGVASDRITGLSWSQDARDTGLQPPVFTKSGTHGCCIHATVLSASAIKRCPSFVCGLFGSISTDR